MELVSAVILAAGKGARFHSAVSKPLVRLGSLPLIAHSLKTFQAHPRVGEIVIVANPANRKAIEALARRWAINKCAVVCLGGKERQDSVGCGLKAIIRQSNLVLIHDAARPFVDRKIISAVIRAAARVGAAVPGVAVKSTIKSVRVSECQSVKDGYFIKETLDRRQLWEIQTPQGFRREIIERAFKKFGRRAVTDDAMLVEKMGWPVALVPGSDYNMKITTPEDLAVARGILRIRSSAGRRM